MNRRPAQILLVSSVLALGSGCVGPVWASFAELHGSGKRATATRDVAAFSRLKIAGSVDAEVHVGSPQSVIVEGDDNLLANVLTDVRDDTLVISADKSYTTRIGLKVKLTTPALDGIEIAGSGDVQADGVKSAAFRIKVAGSADVVVHGTADRLDISIAGSGDVTMEELAATHVDVDIHGSGDVRLRGGSDELAIAVAGSGDVNCADLKARSVSVKVAGSGDAQVFATESIDAVLQGSGDVVYAGNPPTVKKSGSGSGDLMKR